jgi:putative membrane protein
MKWKSSIAVVLLFPALALAHSGEPLRPDDLASAWEFDPGVVIPLVISALLYGRGTYVQRITNRRQNLYFWSGWTMLALALVSPVHALGEVLFSAHMVQHEILMLAAAPLLVLSRPLVTFLFGLPFGWRRNLGQWAKAEYVRRIWTFLTEPLTAWSVHAAAIWIWHAPFLFELTLKSELAHIAQHLSFFLTALLFWWALFYAHGRNAYGLAVFYVFTTAVHTSILGALLTFAPRVWYPAYSTTTQAWGLTPLEDQQIGGLIMWVPAALVYLAAGLWLFACWLKESDLMLERTRSAK